MYVLSKDIDHLEYEEFKVKADEYRQYLDSIKDKLSLSPKDFIFEDWYNEPNSHKCPHDSWLDRLVVSEDSESTVQIELRLLGAYHDGFITFRYSGVQYYNLARHESSIVESSHGDLRYQEFRLDSDGNVIHEFDWYNLGENGLFLIACREIEYIWEPIPEGAIPDRKAEWEAK
ncbi:MAG: hypothetical protein HWE11_03690 [Gammaproteobacteria bacterium]|nr:hypothetical protein [Gammaproteobacteria bacterium]